MLPLPLLPFVLVFALPFTHNEDASAAVCPVLKRMVSNIWPLSETVYVFSVKFDDVLRIYTRILFDALIVTPKDPSVLSLLAVVDRIN